MHVPDSTTQEDPCIKTCFLHAATQTWSQEQANASSKTKSVSFADCVASFERDLGQGRSEDRCWFGGERCPPTADIEVTAPFIYVPTYIKETLLVPKVFSWGGCRFFPRCVPELACVCLQNAHATSWLLEGRIAWLAQSNFELYFSGKV